MAIERDEDGTFTAACDCCGDTINVDADTPAEANSLIRDEGWRVSKPMTTTFGLSPKYSQVSYDHTCPDCEQ